MDGLGIIQLWHIAIIYFAINRITTLFIILQYYKQKYYCYFTNKYVMYEPCKNSLRLNGHYCYYKNNKKNISNKNRRRGAILLI